MIADVFIEVKICYHTIVKKKVFIALVIVAGVILLIFLISKPRPLSEAEKEKALTTILGRTPRLINSNTVQGEVEYKGKYASFLYPASAKVYKVTVNGKEVNTGALEYFDYDLQSPRINVATEVLQAPEVVKSLDDFPAVRLREQDSTYHRSQITADNNQGFSFERIVDFSFEKTGFFLVNGRIYTFSATGGDEKSITSLFEKMIGSLKFL
jgi:hypothetical protein